MIGKSKLKSILIKYSSESKKHVNSVNGFSIIPVRIRYW